MQNPFARRVSGTPWVIPISAGMLVLGFMISLAWITNQTRIDRLSLLGPDQRERLAQGPVDLQADYVKLSAEVKKLREENTKMQNAIATGTNETKLLNESLQQTKMFASLTEVEGPGVIITLRDYVEGKIDAPIDAQIIHDVDILRVVNELWNAGAEAIAIGDLRVGPRTSIRCVGAVVLVDSVKIASPFKIKAIGSPQTLKGALELPGGIVQELRETAGNAMVQIATVEKMKLPAYAGPTVSKHGVLPKVKK